MEGTVPVEGDFDADSEVRCVDYCINVGEEGKGGELMSMWDVIVGWTLALGRLTWGKTGSSLPKHARTPSMSYHGKSMLHLVCSTPVIHFPPIV